MIVPLLSARNFTPISTEFGSVCAAFTGVAALDQIVHGQLPGTGVLVTVGVNVAGKVAVRVAVPVGVEVGVAVGGTAVFVAVRPPGVTVGVGGSAVLVGWPTVAVGVDVGGETDWLKTASTQ